ncbi:phosphate ABC transporter ATP-binding protein PstB [Baekduia soli]|nr:phosphate ABC transporter ATP-binding protein PstB [Baekduia soli]
MTDHTDTFTMDEQRPADPGSSSAARAPLPSRAGQAATAQPPVEVQRAAPGISVRGLEAYYGDNHAIKDVSIEYAANRVTAMIGPSGCGKSTVLRCLNRMHEEIPKARAEGKVLLDDADIYAPGVDVVAVRRAIGMVFQKPNPFPTMSIFDNVAAGLKLNGVKGVDLKERVEESLRGAGLWEEVKDRLDRPGIGLSGGQQQRLCIARTIAVQPAVILMDEPCSALDPIATLKVEELIEDLKARFTIIIVTHNMQQAARVADTTAFFLLGELIEHAPTEKVFTTPSDERTEQYVTGKFG